MPFSTGTEPAGFGCSVSRTGPKLARRSLYTSLLPCSSISGGAGSGVGTLAVRGGRSGGTDDFDDVQREELLSLYLEESRCPRRDGCAQLFMRQLRDHIWHLKGWTLTLVNPREERKTGQRTCARRHRREEERCGEIDSIQREKERKTPWLSAEEAANARFKRFRTRLLVASKWNGASVLLTLCVATLFCLAIALVWLHGQRSGQRTPREPGVLQTAETAADEPRITHEELLQRQETPPFVNQESAPHGERRGVTHAGTPYASPSWRMTGMDGGPARMIKNGDPHSMNTTTASAAQGVLAGSGDLARISLRRWRRFVTNGEAGAASFSPLSSELLHNLVLMLARHKKKLPLDVDGAPDAIVPLQTDVVIRDFMNSQYVIELGVGTPQQTVRVIADTGSSDLWACSEKCGIFCMLHNVYSHSKSSTYSADNSPYNVTYVSGPVSGFLSVDNVSLGDLQAQHVLFAEADNVKGLGPSFFFGHFDGVLGMGLPATSTHGLKPLMQTAIDQQLLKKWIFAFYLSSDDNVDGELTLGGYDPRRVDGPIVYSPLVDKCYWMINTQGLRVKEEMLTKTTRVIVDSGTTLIAGPLDEVDRVALVFGAFAVPMLPKGTYLISCDEALALDDIALMIEGHKFFVKARDLVIRVSDIKGVPCLFGIIGLQILEGKARHKALFPGKKAAVKERLNAVQQQAAGRQGSLLTQLLAQEAVVRTAELQAPQQRDSQDAAESGVAATFLREVNTPDRADVEAGGYKPLANLGRLWIFGDVFMRNVYTIFDYEEKRIGFAKLKGGGFEGRTSRRSEEAVEH